MSTETIFFVLGITLTVSAVVVALVGLRSEHEFPGGAFRLLVAYFVVLVLGTTGMAVVNAETNTKERQENSKAVQEDFSSPVPASSPNY
ncbi:MAG: hypothetical protein U0R52_13400 [Solirubrobacterales bacterium]